MHDLWNELERACERSTHELKEMNDRLEQNKSVISPIDLDNLFKLMDIIKDIKSTMKKIIEIDEMENGEEIQNRYSGGMYYTQPMWDRKYSGNSYRGTYTVSTGDGYSGRRGMKNMYSRDTEKEDMIRKLEDMMSRAKSDQEANAIRESIDSINRL